MKDAIIEKFGGENLAEPATEIKKEESSGLLNVRLVKQNLKVRGGTATLGTIAGIVRGLDVARNIFLATVGSAVLKFVGAAWVASGITGIGAATRSVFTAFQGAVGSFIHTGTIAEASLTSITDGAATYTDGELIGKILKINSKYRVISANTVTIITVADNFGISQLPIAGDTYEIFEPGPVTYYFNTENPQKNEDNFATTTWTATSGIPLFAGATKYKNRIAGFVATTSRLWFSTIRCGDDYPFFEDISPEDGDTISQIIEWGDQLIVFKNFSISIITFESSPNQLEQAVRAENFGCVAPDSVAIIENTLFFLSDRGLEWFNPLEVNLLESQKSLSSYRLPEIGEYTLAEKQAAYGGAHDGKYYLTIGATTYIFDIANYLQRGGALNSKYTFLRDTGYESLAWAVFDDVLYSGGNNKVLEHNTGLTDEGTPINAYWTTREETLAIPKRKKVLRKAYVGTTGSTVAESIILTDTTDIETKVLETKTLAKPYATIKGKRTKGQKHKIKIDISDLGTASLDNFTAQYELLKTP